MDPGEAKHLLKQLDAVLDRWDPIGGCPSGEYTAHGPRILSVLLHGGDAAILERELVAILKHMGLGPDAAPLGVRLILDWYSHARTKAE